MRATPIILRILGFTKHYGLEKESLFSTFEGLDAAES